MINQNDIKIGQKIVDKDDKKYTIVEITGQYVIYLLWPNDTFAPRYRAIINHIIYNFNYYSNNLNLLNWAISWNSNEVVWHATNKRLVSESNLLLVKLLNGLNNKLTKGYVPNIHENHNHNKEIDFNEFHLISLIEKRQSIITRLNKLYTTAIDYKILMNSIREEMKHKINEIKFRPLVQGLTLKEIEYFNEKWDILQKLLQDTKY